MEDVYQSINDQALVNCPQCKENSLERIIYGGVASFVKDVKTIGQLADKNWSNLGHYKRSEIISEDKASKQDSSPFSSARKATKSEINKMTEPQKEKYIITGEK